MEKTICVIDVDGTLLDNFKNIYHTIIVRLFSKSNLALRLNNIFEKINNLDIISNSMFVFKLAIFILSIFSITNFRENLKLFERWYEELATDTICTNYTLYITELLKKGYDVYIISHNEYTKNFSKHLSIPIIVPKNKRKYLPQNFVKHNVAFVIGNNYFDDIVASKKLNKAYTKHHAPHHAIAIYIGTSKLIPQYNMLKFKTLQSAIAFIQKSST